MQIGVFDLCGNTLSFENLPTVYDNTINDTIVTIHQRVEQLLDNDPSIVAIGMAVPGPYLRNVGRTAVVSSMQGWRKINFIDEFATAFRVPVFIEQDARAGALAHYLFDPSVHADGNLAYYLVGEGVGLGVIDNGRLINGFLGAATEIGHISIDVNGRPCDCGNVGPILLDEVRATVAERAIPEINASTSISLSTLSADAAVSGAAAVAVTQFLEHPSVFFDVS